MLKLNQRYLSDQEHNEVIIKFQKEQQMFLEEQTKFRRRIEVMEKEMNAMNDKLKKADDESCSLKHKLKTQDKKHREEMDQGKKLKDETDKKIEQLESSRRPLVGQKKLSTASLPTSNKSKVKPIALSNKENIAQNKTSSLLDSANTPVDDTPDEDKNKLRRQISLLRCQLKKLEVDYRDLKSKSQQEIAQLKDKLNCERKKRMNIYEDKIDKNNQMLQDLLDKDQTIFTLNRQISKLQEKMQAVFGSNGNALNRTPNNILGQSIQDTSMYHQALAQSMVELFPNGQINNYNTSQKRLISPLRSLDLTMLNKETINNLNSLSFSLLPLQNQQSSVSTRGSHNNLATSLNMIKLRNSRDGSIAEVNEELYRDSVESLHNADNNYEDLEQQQIRHQFDKPRKVQNYYTQRLNDEELRSTLLGSGGQHSQKYFDSLDNNSQEEGMSDNEEVRKLINQYSSNQDHNWHTARISSKKDLESKINTTNAPSQKKQKQKVRAEFNEEEDCLVNILEHEDTHIELQPTLVHTRQHLSTENLFRESQNTLETLQSFRNQNIQKQLRDVNRQKQSSIPSIPKPNANNQKVTGLIMNKLRESTNKFAFDTRKNSQVKASASQVNQVVLKSPSSPNIVISNNHIAESSSNKRRLTRNDSCPSPLDEDETVLTLGSGEKLRIRENVIQNIEQYANKFKEQKSKFESNPVSVKNIQRKEQDVGFRARTNSLINSVCSEISVKMKFIRDMPQQETQQILQLNLQTARIKPPSHHSRVPSLKIPSGLSGSAAFRPNTQR